MFWGWIPHRSVSDIEMTGIVGKPRVGYALGDLVRWIENFLGWNRPKAAVLAGAGSLGSALLGYDKFRSHGMEIVAVFDVDPGEDWPANTRAGSTAAAVPPGFRAPDAHAGGGDCDARRRLRSR